MGDDVYPEWPHPNFPDFTARKTECAVCGGPVKIYVPEGQPLPSTEDITYTCSTECHRQVVPKDPS